MSDPLVVAPVRPEQYDPAFRLLFRQVRPADLEARLANLRYLVERGELPREGVLTATLAGAVCGVLVTQLIPGASGLVWPPQALELPEQEFIENALVRQGLAWLRSRGARLAQTILSTEELALANPLLRNGFRHVTRLWYMEHHLTSITSFPFRQNSLVLERYAQLADPAVFGETLLRSYVGSEDCPEVNELRTVDEVLEGHRAQGKDAPSHWWLASHHGVPVGVLVMAEVPEWASYDVAYVGIVPEARGRGFGWALMCKALDAAAGAGLPRVTLSVDDRNRTARRLYSRMGFVETESREVFLALWGQRV